MHLVQGGFLIFTQLLVNFGPDTVTIARDTITRSKVKLEWNHPFQDENQALSFFCSGYYQAKGQKRVKTLQLGETDVAIQAVRNQMIHFNGAESDINNTQVSPKVRHVIPLPAKVRSQPSSWISTNMNGKRVKVEGAVALLEIVALLPGGSHVPLSVAQEQNMTLPHGTVFTTRDTGTMLMHFKREDADENTMFRLTPPRRQPYRMAANGINFNLRPPPQQPAHPLFPVAQPPQQAPPPLPQHHAQHHAPQQQQQQQQPGPVGWVEWQQHQQATQQQNHVPRPAAVVREDMSVTVETVTSTTVDLDGRSQEYYEDEDDADDDTSNDSDL